MCTEVKEHYWWGDVCTLKSNINHPNHIAIEKVWIILSCQKITPTEPDRHTLCIADGGVYIIGVLIIVNICSS